MGHKKVFWQVIALASVWLLVLFFGLITKDWNLTKIAILLSIVFLAGIMYLFWQLTKEERKEIKLTLSAWQSVLDPLSEGIVLYQKDKIMFANRKFLSLVKLNLNDLLALNLGTWLTENPRYQLLGDIFYPFVRGEKVTLIAKEPETLKVKFTEPERHFLLIYTSLTLDQTYEMRVVLDQTKEVISRREEKEFLSLITHHLRTPLNHIRWFLEALTEEKLAPEEKESLQVVRQTANQLIFVVEELLLFASAEEKVALQAKMISIKEMVSKITSNLKHLIESKRLTVKVSISALANEIPADERLFYLLLFTLMENAIVYNRDGGEVSLTVDLIKEKPYVLIKIKDTGIGIPEKEIDRIFDKHFRASNARQVKGEGLGLGLYLAKKIVHWHGGEIKVSSKENQGTEFTLLWPRKLELLPTESDEVK